MNFKIYDGNKKIGSISCSENIAKIMEQAFKESGSPKVTLKEVKQKTGPQKNEVGKIDIKSK